MHHNREVTQVNSLKGVEFWKKYLSRKFLLAVVILTLGVVGEAVPDLPNLVPWEAVAPGLAYIFGKIGRDIIRDYMSYKYEAEK
jgi:uncharacterized protein with HEPN domain